MNDEQQKKFDELFEQNLEYIQGIKPGDPLDPDLIAVFRLLIKARVILEGIANAKDKDE